MQTGGEVPDLIPTVPCRSCRRQPESLCPQHRGPDIGSVGTSLHCISGPGWKQCLKSIWPSSRLPQPLKLRDKPSPAEGVLHPGDWLEPVIWGTLGLCRHLTENRNKWGSALLKCESSWAPVLLPTSSQQDRRVLPEKAGQLKGYLIPENERSSSGMARSPIVRVSWPFQCTCAQCFQLTCWCFIYISLMFPPTCLLPVLHM